mmetsp:Transcript_19475/g.28154  ORF Transcript_19475/g.28154 Transcript_19475/m.28154 type:complete len:85 (-) Transcript_19475:150-404(-)
MPTPPGLGRRKVSSSPTHVTEGTLSGTRRTATTDTGNTGDGTAGTPGAGDGLLAGVDVDGERLAFVLVHVGVDELDDVRAEGGQ